MIKLFNILWTLLIPASVLSGSHSFCALITYIKGNTEFPEFSITLMLDDMTVGYYDSETATYFPRGNKTNEDDLYDLGDNRPIRNHLHDYLVFMSIYRNYTESMFNKFNGLIIILN